MIQELLIDYCSEVLMLNDVKSVEKALLEGNYTQVMYALRRLGRPLKKNGKITF